MWSTIVKWTALVRLATQFPRTKGVEVTSCQEDRDWALYVMLTNGTVFGCDLVVSATGVTPSAGDIVVKGGGAVLVLVGDGGVKVDRQMSRVQTLCSRYSGTTIATGASVSGDPLPNAICLFQMRSELGLGRWGLT